MAKKEALEYIGKTIEEIENDSRFKAKTATIDINAPLAMEQLALETKRNVLYILKKKLEE